MASEKRVSTNIPGLDSLMQGGIPEGELLLLSGTCGTGKTIFGMQFVMQGSQGSPEKDDASIYVTFEEHRSQLRAQAARFGWDMKKLEDMEKLRMLRYDPFQIRDILGMIENNIREVNARKVVMDSVSSFAMYLHDENEIRKTIIQVCDLLKKNKCTGILISEILPNSHALSRYGIEEFVLDGVLVLRKIMQENQFKRALNIWKLRETNHSSRFHEYDISAKGFTLYPDKVVDFDKVQFYT
jgi:KaiC/GvpD/RAD55 family RecA-like ATPase